MRNANHTREVRRGIKDKQIICGGEIEQSKVYGTTVK